MSVNNGRRKKEKQKEDDPQFKEKRMFRCKELSLVVFIVQLEPH